MPERRGWHELATTLGPQIAREPPRCCDREMRETGRGAPIVYADHVTTVVRYTCARCGGLLEREEWQR